MEAVRAGKWKLHFAHPYRETPKVRATGGTPTKAGTGRIELSLFDLESDAGETKDVSKEHPDVVERIKKLADGMRKDLGDSATKEKGSGRREPGRIADAK